MQISLSDEQGIDLPEYRPEHEHGGLFFPTSDMPPNLPRPNLQRAALQDAGFIYSQVQNGARHGHFNQHAANDKTTLRAYIQSAISQGIDLSGYATEFFIVWLEGKRIGVALMTAAIGIPDRGVELAMIALKKEYRGSGYGAFVLDQILDHYLPNMSVYARCYPASRQLQEMLLRRDFAEVGTVGGSVILRHGAIGQLSPNVSSSFAAAAPQTPGRQATPGEI